MIYKHLIKSFLLGITVPLSLVTFMTSVNAATMSGSFSFMGKSTYYAWKFKGTCDDDTTNPKNKITMDVEFELEKIMKDGKYVLDSSKNNKVLFTQRSTTCTKAEKWNNNTYTVKMTDAKFGANWEIKKINFDGIVDPKTYKVKDIHNSAGSIITLQNGRIVGFFDFITDAELRFIYEEITDPKNPKEYKSDDIEFLTKPPSANGKKKTLSRPGTPIPPEGRIPGELIPEPSSTLTLLALGILGAALTLKRKT